MRADHPDHVRIATAPRSRWNNDGMSNLSAVRVVLCDDHPIWRSGVRADLGENFNVVGEAGDADEAIAVITKTKPDLVVCDLHKPNGGGIMVAKACGESTRI